MRTGRPKQPLILTEEERERLESLAHRARSQPLLVRRARVGLACAEGLDYAGVTPAAHIRSSQHEFNEVFRWGASLRGFRQQLQCRRQRGTRCRQFPQSPRDRRAIRHEPSHQTRRRRIQPAVGCRCRQCPKFRSSQCHQRIHITSGKNSAPEPATVRTTSARSRKSFPCSQLVSAISTQPWHAAP